MTLESSSQSLSQSACRFQHTKGRQLRVTQFHHHPRLGALAQTQRVVSLDDKTTSLRGNYRLKIAFVSPGAIITTLSCIPSHLASNWVSLRAGGTSASVRAKDPTVQIGVHRVELMRFLHYLTDMAKSVGLFGAMDPLRALKSDGSVTLSVRQRPPSNKKHSPI